LSWADVSVQAVDQKKALLALMGSTGPNIKQKLFGQIAARDAVRHCDTFSLEGTRVQATGQGLNTSKLGGQDRVALGSCAAQSGEP
jgi:hypothetical protein